MTWQSDRELLETQRPFTHAQALAAGMYDRELTSPAYRRVFPGVYVASEVPDTVVVRARAALLIAPSRAVLSHATAARLWGAAHLDDPRIHISLSRDVRARADGIVTHRFRQPFASARRHGLPVTTPEQTFVHCAVRTDLLDLVGLGDRLVKREEMSVTTIDGLHAFAELYDGQGRTNALRAARLVRTRVDSVTETHLRLLTVLAGLPEPTVDVRLYHPDGTLRYRLDLGFEENRLAIEYDGRWHLDPAQQLADAARRTELTDEGWRFEVVTAEDLYQTPESTLLRIRSAMQERDIVVPPHFSDGWRRYFARHRSVA